MSWPKLFDQLSVWGLVLALFVTVAATFAFSPTVGLYTIAAWLVAMAVLRLIGPRRAWFKARSRWFDVATLLLLAGVILIFSPLAATVSPV